MAARRPSRATSAGSSLPSPLLLLSVAAVALAGAAFVATTAAARAEAARSAAAPTTTVRVTHADPDRRPRPPSRSRRPSRRSRSWSSAATRLRRGVQQLRHHRPGRQHRRAGPRAPAGRSSAPTTGTARSRPARSTTRPRLQAAAKLLAKDLGIGRIKPAIAPMRVDRLTVILTDRLRLLTRGTGHGVLPRAGPCAEVGRMEFCSADGPGSGTTPWSRRATGVVVGLDFDGTLSPIVEDPEQAVIHPDGPERARSTWPPRCAPSR